MAAECYELSDGQWANIASLLPGKLGDPDRTGSDNRALNDGYLWLRAPARSGVIYWNVMASGRRCTSSSAVVRYRHLGCGSLGC